MRASGMEKKRLLTCCILSLIHISADIFFRVNRICGKSEIVVSDGERKLCAFPREHLAPGEMEHILLPRKLLGENPPTQLTVSICEKQA